MSVAQRKRMFKKTKRYPYRLGDAQRGGAVHKTPFEFHQVTVVRGRILIDLLGIVSADFTVHPFRMVGDEFGTIVVKLFVRCQSSGDLKHERLSSSVSTKRDVHGMDIYGFPKRIRGLS